MASSHFLEDRQPGARDFYVGEGYRLGRVNRKGWMMAIGQTICHASKSGKSFSVHDSGGFFCHGCKTGGGGVVDYVMLRDGCGFKEAAMKLGCWDEAPSPETARKLAEQARERDREREAEELRQAEARAARLALRDEVHATATIQREVSDRLCELQSGATEAYPDESGHCWAVLSLCLEDLRMSEAEYVVACGLEYSG